MNEDIRKRNTLLQRITTQLKTIGEEIKQLMSEQSQEKGSVINAGKQRIADLLARRSRTVDSDDRGLADGERTAKDRIKKAAPSATDLLIRQSAIERRTGSSNKEHEGAESRKRGFKDEAQTVKNAAEQIKRQQKSLIQEKAKELNSQFRNKWLSVAAILVTYSFLSTVLTAFNSERCVSDIKAAGQLISKVFMVILKVIYTIATGAGSIGTHIQQPVVSTIVTYLVDIIVAALCVGVIGAGLFFGGKALVNCYTEYCLDEISPLVALSSLAILVWGAELMPLNIVLLLILFHAAYIIVRWYIDGYKEARGLR